MLIFGVDIEHYRNYEIEMLYDMLFDINQHDLEKSGTFEPALFMDAVF